MQAKLTDRQTIAEGSMAVEFLPTSEPLNFTPGQFFTLTLPNPLFSDNRGSSRHLGFTGLPQANGLITTAFREGPSAFKRSLMQMPLGTDVEISDSGGNLLLPADSSRPLVVIVGGIGIVPIISLLRQIKADNLPHKITLIFSNTTQSRAMFLSELQDQAASNPNFNFIPIMTQDSDWKGDSGRLDEQSFSHLISDFSTPQFYITGTPRFVPDMVRHLKNLGVEMPSLKFEIFSGY